jgi:FkbM family methyltransferase
MESVLLKIKRNISSGTLFKRGFAALGNRCVKWYKHANIFHAFDKERIMTKQYLEDIPHLSSNHIACGNYYLDSRIPLGKDSVVYSLGILTDISFDLAISNKYGCPVYMYDPTPITIDFMKQHTSNHLLKYKPVAVWIENTSLKFYEPSFGGSASLFGKTDDTYFEAKCFTIAELMAENNHEDIDVFKADIEGAALPVFEQMLENEVLPDQVIVEFERPRDNMSEVISFFDRITNIRTILKSKGFEEFQLPRGAAKYYSLELLFVNAKK